MPLCCPDNSETLSGCCRNQCPDAAEICSYLVGFIIFIITKEKSALGIGILPMVFFGMMGLFIFPWGGVANIPQVGHLVMTLNVIWAVYTIVKTADYKALALGLLASIILYVPFIAYQQIYCRMHTDDLQRIIGIK